MGKHRIAYALSAAALIVGSGIFAPGVWAEGEEAQDTEVSVVDTADELYAALYYGGNYKLDADVNTSDSAYGSSLYALQDTVLDLNDHTITLSDETASIYTWGGDLTIDGAGTVSKTAAGDYPLFYIYSSGNLIIDGGTIQAGNYAAWVLDGNSLTLNDGKIEASDYGVVVYGADTDVIVNGGEINAGKFAISGNGSTQYAGAKITINGGTLTAGGTGIYAPQIDGETVITDGEITGGDAGVEIRAGNLEITGGEISSTANEYSVNANGSGATTRGAAVAVAQHSTKQAINVNISGGTFEGPVAFSEANPQENSEEDIAKISLNITGGRFVGDIVSEDFDRDDFVTGGSFGNNVTSEDENVSVEIEGAVVAESPIGFAANEVDTSSLTLAESSDKTEIVMARDLKLVDENGDEVSVSKEDNVSMTVHIALSGDEYMALKDYEKVVVIYFDEDGVEQERIDATLSQREDGGWDVVFETDHMSTYAVAGVNSATNDETSDGSATETTTAGTPETGTMTIAEASATSAALVTAILVGLLTSVVSFTYLTRRR